MLSAEAHAVLAEQIERLAPSAAVLESKGVDWQTAATLARFIKTGEPDLGELRDHGIAQATAVEICTSISARHARKAAALAAVPSLPAPAPKPAPKPDAEDMYGMKALSMLHTLFQQAESGRIPCLTLLMNDGWSESTARELVRTINAARTAR